MEKCGNRCILFLLLFSGNLIGKVFTTENEFQLELNELTGINKERAEKILEETPEKLQEKLSEFRNLLKEDENLKVPIDDENFLLKFLRFAKHDVKKAHDRIKYYYNFEKRYRNEASSNLTSATVKKLFEEEVIYILPNRDKNGRRILVIQVGKWDASRINRNDLFRGIQIAAKLVLLEPNTQISGISGLVDFNGFSYSQLLELSIDFVRMAFDWIQRAEPMEIGKTHFINNPFIFNILWTIMKPFMEDELKSKIHIDNSDYSKMTLNFGENALPKHFGGQLPDQKFGKQFLKVLEEHQSYFEELSKFGYQTNLN